MAAIALPAQKPSRGLLLRALLLIVTAGILGVGTDLLRGSPVNLTQPYAPSFQAHRMNAASAKKWLGKAVFLDMRSSVIAYQSGHIPGALQLSLNALEENPALLESRLGPDYRSLVTILYCNADCTRADKAASILTKDGCSDIYVLEGGFPGWKEAGFAVDTGTGTSIMASSAEVQHD